MIRRAVELPAAAAPSLHLGLSVSPLGDDSSAPHGVICLFTDLSAVVALEEQVRLKDSLAQVGELTAGIAHEFRNGLATIHGYARLLDLDRLPADTRPYVIGIRGETDTLAAIVRNFLHLATPAAVELTAVDARALRARPRPRPGAGAEGHRHAQRPGHLPARTGRRHALHHLPPIDRRFFRLTGLPQATAVRRRASREGGRRKLQEGKKPSLSRPP